MVGLQKTGRESKIGLRKPPCFSYIQTFCYSFDIQDEDEIDESDHEVDFFILNQRYIQRNK